MFRPWLILLGCVLLQSSPTPVIDGVISQDEWAGAQRGRLAAGGEVQLLERGEFLFVSVRGPRAGLASLCIAKGKSVRILHASAALGDALFERWGDLWMKRRDFLWRRDLRRVGLSEPAASDWFEKTGWIANAGATGSTSREFRILAREVEYLGVVFLATDEPMWVSYWPSTMSDDCRSLKIPQGYLPDTARFDPATWHAMSRMTRAR